MNLTIRTKLMPAFPWQFLEEGSLLLMSLSGGEVEDDTVVHVFQKGASSRKNVLSEAVAVARGHCT